MRAKKIKGVVVHATFYYPDVVLADGDTLTLHSELTSDLSKRAVRELLTGGIVGGSDGDSAEWVEAMELEG